MGIKKGLNPRFAEVGKIKIGGKGETRKSKDGKDYQLPVRYEHFVVTTTEKGKDGNFVINHELMKQLGSEPKEIPIRLPFDDIDLNFFTSFQYYSGNKCICRGDGEKAERTGQDGITKTVKCDPDSCEFLKTEKCKVSGILSCQIPLSGEIGGIYRFKTHSWNSVSSILAGLEYFAQNTNGILQGLPLKLKFLKKATQDHGNVNIVTIVLDGIELVKMREIAYLEYENRMKMGIDMNALQQKAREIGFNEDKDDPEDIQVEFYPTYVEDLSGVTAEETAEKLRTDKKPVDSSVQGELL